MIIPVLDLKNGEAVSGKSGLRNTYKPLKTVFNDSSDPIEIVKALKIAGYTELYVADLDAIEGNGSNLELAGRINDIIPVMYDIGINNFEDVKSIINVVEKIIIATETIQSIKELDLIFSLFSKQNLVLSVDVLDGKILGKHIKVDFFDILKKIEDIKPLQVILLDISRVGTKKGFDQDIVKNFVDIDTELIIGGGVTKSDIQALKELDVRNYLIGTALHNGSFK
jgi:phosphoribosylformimino-5-aminoimidazole carboxamide ribotide isomerase